MRRIAFFIPAFCLLLIACKHPTQFKEVQSQKGFFTLEVPTYMSVSHSIFPNLSEIEYRNDSIPMYVVGFDTSRDGLFEATLKQYYDSAEAHQTIDSSVLEKPQFAMVNGDSALTSRLTGNVAGEKFVYRIETLATPDKFYYILVWTKASAEKSLEADIERILKSFHDTNHKKE
jgi:hypothetical protein